MLCQSMLRKISLPFPFAESCLESILEVKCKKEEVFATGSCCCQCPFFPRNKSQKKTFKTFLGLCSLPIHSSFPWASEGADPSLATILTHLQSFKITVSSPELYKYFAIPTCFCLQILPCSLVLVWYVLSLISGTICSGLQPKSRQAEKQDTPWAFTPLQLKFRIRELWNKLVWAQQRQIALICSSMTVRDFKPKLYWTFGNILV